MNTAYLLLGSNIGSRENYLLQAIELLETNAGRIVAKSSVYKTAAWPARTTVQSGGGNQNQNDFLNQVVCVETKLSAEKLLEEILKIEKQLGRERKEKWEARIIDIDILFFNQLISISAHLHIPHPHLHERRFALVPLAEIAPELIHPVLGKSVSALLEQCPDNLAVNPAPKP